MYLQRANADGSIPDAAVTEAIAQSKQMGAASHGLAEHRPGVGRARPEQHRWPHPRHRRRPHDQRRRLHRHRHRWPLANDGRRRDLRHRVGRPAAPVDGRRRGRLPGRRVGRHRRARPRWRLRVLRQGHLQVHRRRRDLDQHGPERRRHDRPDRHRPARRRPGVRRRHGRAARHRADPRPVHDRGRRRRAGPASSSRTAPPPARST